ncbi:MAG TPA: MGMT family protein [Clostridiales bacterium]|jgi:methylated-DNA-protein-cysteine methyltransferase-like protein|nr:MGMT family protein [Clostridiales bacterium]
MTADYNNFLSDKQTRSGFFSRVYRVVACIPCGSVVSYGQIAWYLGAPRAARQVGWAMRRCPDELPWQRVVMADGSVTGGLFAEERRMRLEEEGVPFLSDGRVDIDACRWDIEYCTTDGEQKR